MGCCLSTGDHHPEANSTGAAPPTSPPPVLEEETVKEVLLETPAAVAPKADHEELMPPEWKVGVEPTAAHGYLDPLMPPEWKVGVEPTAAHGYLDPHGKGCDEEIVSEVSDMCSYSESYSNAVAHEEKLDGEEDGVVNQRPPVRKRRGPTGGRGRGRSGERVIARRTAAPSPERRGPVAPLRPARGRQTAGQQRNVADENLGRREAGDDSRRRSRSPARRDVDAPRRNAGGEKSAGAMTGTRDSPNDVVPGDEAESLENPVVSLECFIFL